MDFSDYKIRPSKHMISTWMTKWNIDIDTLVKYLANAYKIEKVGKNKYGAYIRVKGGGKKLIFIKDDEFKNIFIITGAEGK